LNTGKERNKEKGGVAGRNREEQELEKRRQKDKPRKYA